MLRLEISCWVSEVGTGIQRRTRPASLGSSLERTVYLNSNARDEPEPGASAETPAAKTIDPASRVAPMRIPRPRMRRIIASTSLQSASPGLRRAVSDVTLCRSTGKAPNSSNLRSEEHTSELQSLAYLVCRLLLEKKKKLTLYTYSQVCYI